MMKWHPIECTPNVVVEAVEVSMMDRIVEVIDPLTLIIWTVMLVICIGMWFTMYFMYHTHMREVEEVEDKTSKIKLSDSCQHDVS